MSVMNYCNPTWSNNGLLSANDVAGARRFYGYPAQQDQRFAAGDVDGDHRADLLQLWRGYNSGSNEQRFIAADVDGDGKTDVVQAYRGWSSYPVCLSTGTGWNCSNVPAAVYNPGY